MTTNEVSLPQAPDLAGAPSARSQVAVCTLWEGDYHKGLGVLVNSLVRAGYTGTIWAGYRGSLPPWVDGSTASNGRLTFHATPNVFVSFLPIESKVHFSQFKPDFCLQVLNELQPGAAGVYYFDPDIILLGRWSFFERWLNAGIAVCEDSHYPLNPRHPVVAEWTAYAESKGLTTRKPVTSYINSGSVGVKRESAQILDLWRNLVKSVQTDFHLADRAHFGTRIDPFHNIDQDVLTLALAVTDLPVSAVGADGMAFHRGEWLMLHATGKKPWRRRIFRDLLRDGVGPDRALRRYWEFADAPIAVEPSSRIKRHRKWIPLVAILSRFYGRSA